MPALSLVEVGPKQDGFGPALAGMLFVATGCLLSADYHALTLPRDPCEAHSRSWNNADYCPDDPFTNATASPRIEWGVIACAESCIIGGDGDLTSEAVSST